MKSRAATMPRRPRTHTPGHHTLVASALAARARSLALALHLGLGWLALAAVAPHALAERADRDKPVNVEADAMRYDDAKRINVFTGNVTLTKGTIVIRADRLVLRQDAAGYAYATATGSPASFRQKRDGVDQYVVGVGEQLDYDGKTETIRMQTRANLKRLEKDRVSDELHGELIVYDSRTESIDVKGGGPSAATAENPGGRVRVVIQPRSATQPSAPEPTPLTPADRLQSAPR
jgi:lipopolysaccharide export system protein LptA